MFSHHVLKEKGREKRGVRDRCVRGWVGVSESEDFTTLVSEPGGTTDFYEKIPIYLWDSDC